MNQKQQFLTQAEQSLNQLSGTVNTVLNDVRNYSMEFALALNQQPGETATNTFNKGLTMYDKFSESLQRVERIVMKENTLIQQVDQLKGIIINFFEVLKDHKAQMGDVNNPFCQQMITLSEQKKNDEIKANPGKANEITKEFEAEKQY